MISSDQVRAARALLRIEQATLAAKAGVSLETVRRIEAAQGEWKGRYESLRAVQTALEYAGVEFIESEGPQGFGGSGVRFAIDRTAKYRNLIANQVRDLTAAVLSSKLSNDLTLFEKDPSYVADELIRDLVPLIKHSMATTLKFK